MRKILNQKKKIPEEKSKVSNYSFYKRILCLTKRFLETAKPQGWTGGSFCFIICLSKAEEKDKGITSSSKFLRKDYKIPKGKGRRGGDKASVYKVSVGSGSQETETGQL